MASEDLWLVAALGNPGAKYQNTRHNIGFLAADMWCEKREATFKPEKRFQADVARVRTAKWECLVAKPQTYMNLSGESIGPLSRYFRIPSDRIIVLHDELDLPPGIVRLKRGGGAGGHNGLKSLIEHLGGPDFLRVRLGIGRPPPPQEVVSYVLSNFRQEDVPLLEEQLPKARKAVETVFRDGLQKAMNRVNRAEKPKKAADSKESQEHPVERPAGKAESDR